MDLGFFRGNEVIVTPAPLDIRLICFARPSAHNTLHETWKFSTFNRVVTSLNLENTRACFFSKSSTLWHPLFIRNFCIPKSFSKSQKFVIDFFTKSFDFFTVVRLVQPLKLWDCVSTLQTSYYFFANFASILMKLDSSSSINCLFLSRKFEENSMVSFSNFSFLDCRADLLGPIDSLETFASSSSSFTIATWISKKTQSFQDPSNTM